MSDHFILNLSDGVRFLHQLPLSFLAAQDAFFPPVRVQGPRPWWRMLENELANVQAPTNWLQHTKLNRGYSIKNWSKQCTKGPLENHKKPLKEPLESHKNPLNHHKIPWKKTIRIPYSCLLPWLGFPGCCGRSLEWTRIPKIDEYWIGIMWLKQCHKPSIWEC